MTVLIISNEPQMAAWSIVLVWAAKCGVMCINKAGEGKEEMKREKYFS